jgi:cytochrome P450
VAKPEMWKVHRKIMEPAFNIGVLKGFIPTYNQHSRTAMKNFSKLCDTEAFNIIEPLSALTLDNILHTAMDKFENIQAEEKNQYLDHINK